MSTENTKIQLPFQTSHAFIIGINAYEHLNPLTTAVRDAEVLAQVLAEDHDYQVHPPLLNATRAELARLFTEIIPQRVEKEDRILIYFAGHGIALNSDDNPKGYLVPVDAQPGEEETLVSMDVLHEAINKVPCKHGLLILDCCFAGAFKWSTGTRDVVFDLPSIIYEERFYQYARDPAWQVITSSASDQKAADILSDRTLGFRNEGEAEHSPFAEALFEGLAGAADIVPRKRGDGVITATELYTYLRDCVEDETTEQGKRQSPSLFSLQRHNKGQYIFLHPRHPLNLPPIPDRSPFMGLKSFEESDHRLFYGRDRVIDELHQLVSQRQLVVVSGASGTGKSSVVKAGLLPLLRENDWHIWPIVRPGRDPVQALQAKVPSLTNGWQQDQPGILFIDQYEELITRCANDQERQDFESQLFYWLKTHPKLHLVVSVRSDFEPQFENGAFGKQWHEGRYAVPAFSQAELREVIVKPAAQEVLFFEPESLVDQILADVSQAPGALSLLSFMLSELYHAYLKSGRTNRALIQDDYSQLGGAIGALRTKADTIYKSLDTEHRLGMRLLMLRMISLDGGELASRRVFAEDLILNDEGDSERIRTVAERLVEARLVSTGSTADEKTYYEPTHDALVRAWPLLWEWIRAVGKDRLNLLHKLTAAVADHEEYGTKDYLWSEDPRLTLLHASLSVSGHIFNKREAAFLEKSHRQRQQRLRWRYISLIGFIMGLVVLTTYAFILKGVANRKTQEALEQTKLALQERDRASLLARKAQAANLSIKAIEHYPNNNTLALNMAMAAYELFPVAENAVALHTILSNPDSRFYSKQFAGHQSTIYDLAISPRGGFLVTASRDPYLRMWDITTGDFESIASHQQGIACVDFSPTGNHLATGSWDKTAKIWTLQGDLVTTLSGHQSSVNSLAFSPDGAFVLTGSSDQTARLWDLEGNLLLTLDRHRSSINSVAFSPDGELMLTGSDDKTARLWNRQGKNLQTLRGHTDWVSSVAFSPDGQYLLTGSDDKTAKLWDTSGKLIRTFNDRSENIYDVAFSPDNKSIVTAAGDGLITMWRLDGSQVAKFIGHEQGVYCLAFTPDGEQLLSGSMDKMARLWNVKGEEVQTIDGHQREVTSATFSPDGQQILTGSGDKIVRLWDTRGEERLSLSGHRDLVTSVAFSPDGQFIVSGSRDSTARLWNSDTSAITEFLGHKGAVNAVAFGKDNQTILTGSEDGKVRLWNPDGSLQMVFNDLQAPVQCVTYFPNDQTIAAGSSEGIIKIWHPEQKRIQTLNAHTGSVHALAFSPDGAYLVSGGDDRVVRLWDLNQEDKIDFNGHGALVSDVTFSPDGQYILSSSWDETVKLWSCNGEALLTLPAHGGHVNSVDFSPDGQYLLASNGKKVLLWHNFIGAWREDLIWNRIYALSAEECQRYGMQPWGHRKAPLVTTPQSFLGSPSDSSKQYAMVIRDQVNLRKEPVNGLTLLRLREGERVVVLNRRLPSDGQNAWYLVEHPNGQGWMRGDMLGPIFTLNKTGEEVLIEETPRE